MKKCPMCAEEVQDEARKCKHCGEILDPALREEKQQEVATAAVREISQNPPRRSPGVAAVLSLVIPGAGQMYKGGVVGGLAWLFFTVACYAVFLPVGILVHIVCVLCAGATEPEYDDKPGAVKSALMDGPVGAVISGVVTILIIFLLMSSCR